MKYFTSTLSVVFLLVASAAAYAQEPPQSSSQSQTQPETTKKIEAQKQPQSLAELARREKERREKVTAALKSLTNENTGKYQYVKPAPPEPEKKAGEEGEAQPEAQPRVDKPEKVEKAEKTEAAPASDEPVDMQGRTESFWRQAFSDARQKVKSLEDEGNVLTLKLNDLQNQFYREANGFKQQDLQRQIQKTIYEQDKNKDELKKAKDDLSDLEKEARKSGALPGGFRARSRNQTARRRASEKPAGYWARYSTAMPADRGLLSTAVKPAAATICFNSSGRGNACTLSGRYLYALATPETAPPRSGRIRAK